MLFEVGSAAIRVQFGVGSCVGNLGHVFAESDRVVEVRFCGLKQRASYHGAAPLLHEIVRFCTRI